MDVQEITGGCACGQLRYTCSTEPAAELNCHCRKCQYMSGGGHGAIVVLLKEKTKVAGEASTWSYTADSGGQVTRHFCPNCGVTVYSLLELHPLAFAATAGSLDQPERFKPKYALFTVESQDWDPIPEHLQKMPAGLEHA